MAGFRWVLLDSSKQELRSTEEFDTKEAAEAWMGSEWRALLDEGGEFVSLRSGSEQLYLMGLREQ